MTKYIVIGPARAGKTTFAKILARFADTKATDTSEAIIAVETARLSHPFGGHDNWKMDVNMWDPVRQRPPRYNLIRMGDALKVLSLTLLADYCFDRGNVCSGIRKLSELEAVRAKYPEAVTIYIDGPETVSDSFDIDEGYANYTVWNPKRSVGELEADANIVLALQEIDATRPLPVCVRAKPALDPEPPSA